MIRLLEPTRRRIKPAAVVTAPEHVVTVSDKWPRELEYRVSGLILDNDLYRALTKNRASACDMTTDTLLASNYFSSLPRRSTRG